MKVGTKVKLITNGQTNIGYVANYTSTDVRVEVMDYCIATQKHFTYYLNRPEDQLEVLSIP